MLYIQTMLLPCRRIGGIRSCFCSCSIYFIIDFYKDIAVYGSFCCSFKFVRLCLSLCSKYLQITLPYEAPLLSKATRSTAAIYLACGVDSSKVCLTVFWLFCMCTLLLLCIMTLCVFRLLSLYSLMSVLMLSWCGYWVLLLLLAGWIEWSSSKRSLARRCVTCCTTAFTIKFCLRN